MVCLSAADLLVNCVAQPVLILLQIDRILQSTLVKIDLFIQSSIFLATGASSLFILTILNVDRAVACTFPIIHKVHFTKKRLFLGVLATFPWPYLKFLSRRERFTPGAVIAGLCLTIILVSCVIMILSLKKSANRTDLVGGGQMQLIQRNLRQRKASRTVLLLVALQLVLYLPIVVILLNKSLESYRPLAGTLTFSNSCLNSVIYIARNDAIARRYKEIFQFKMLRGARVAPVNGEL